MLTKYKIPASDISFKSSIQILTKFGVLFCGQITMLFSELIYNKITIKQKTCYTDNN